MVQELRVKNFCSFRDEVVLNFEASQDSFAEKYQVVELDNLLLLRYAIIYGYNASGKSNLLDAIDYLKEFWTYRPEDIDEGARVTPFKLDRVSRNNPSEFKLIFFVDSIKYEYQLQLDEKVVYLEKLSYYEGNRQIMLFLRSLEKGQSVVYYNTSDEQADKVSQVVSEAISVKCLKNTSFFVARNQVNTSLPRIDAAKEWLKNGLIACNLSFNQFDKLCPATTK